MPGVEKYRPHPGNLKCMVEVKISDPAVAIFDQTKSATVGFLFSPSGGRKISAAPGRLKKHAGSGKISAAPGQFKMHGGSEN